MSFLGFLFMSSYAKSLNNGSLLGLYSTWTMFNPFDLGFTITKFAKLHLKHGGPLKASGQQWSRKSERWRDKTSAGFLLRGFYLSYQNKETIVIAIDPHSGSLIKSLNKNLVCGLKPPSRNDHKQQ